MNTTDKCDVCTTVNKSINGRNNGGIYNLEDIRCRCVIDLETDCWHWRGAMASKNTKSTCPVAWSPIDKKILSVLRLSYRYSHPLAHLTGRIVWRNCMIADCCNPRHLLIGTIMQRGAWIAASGAWKNKPLVSSRNRNARIASGSTVLTMELAQWARESKQLGIHVAHALGVSATTISRARQRKTWKDSIPWSSAWSMALCLK